MNIAIHKNHTTFHTTSPVYTLRTHLNNILTRINGFLTLSHKTLNAHKTENELNIGYTPANKQQARDIVHELVLHIAKFGHLSTADVTHYPEVEMVMARYQFRELDELNDWLSHF